MRWSKSKEFILCIVTTFCLGYMAPSGPSFKLLGLLRAFDPYGGGLRPLSVA